MPGWARVAHRAGHVRAGVCPGGHFTAAQADCGDRPPSIESLPVGVPMEALTACPGHVHEHERCDRQHDDPEEYFLQHARHALQTADGIRVMPSLVR